MGSRGPAKKRTGEHVGHPKKADEPANRTDKPDGAKIVKQPAPDKDWHPVAKRWYESLAESGQSQFYEPSDWAVAYTAAESLSRDLNPRYVATDGEGDPIVRKMPLNGASLTAYMRVMTDLLVTEAARRRANVELQRPGTGPNIAEQAARGKVADARQRFERKTG